MMWIERKAVPLVLASVGTLAMLMIAFRLREAAQLIPLNYNEGWNAYHAAHWLKSGTAYPPLGGLVMNNYPPLWFPLVALGGTVTDSLLMGGRLAATVGMMLMLAAVGAVGGTLRGRTGAIAALVTCSLVLVSEMSEYVGIADPQLVAQGVTALALLLSVRARSPQAPLYQAAIFVGVLSGFIKHNVAALPFALLLVVLFEDSRTIVRSLVTVVLALAVGYLLGAMVGGWQWPTHLMAVRIYSVSRALDRSTSFISTNLLGLFLAVLGLRTLADGHVRRVLMLYLLFALPIACIFAGGQGVNINIYIDIVVPMSIGASLMFSLQSDGVAVVPERRKLLLPPMLAVAAVTVWLMNITIPRMREIVYARHNPSIAERVADFQNDIAFVKASPGNALCEELTLCYLAGKPFMLDPFNTDQEYQAKRITDRDIDRFLSDTTLTVVQLQALGSHYGIFAPVGEHFVATRRGLNMQFFERKRPPDPPARVTKDDGATGITNTVARTGTSTRPDSVGIHAPVRGTPARPIP